MEKRHQRKTKKPGIRRWLLPGAVIALAVLLGGGAVYLLHSRQDIIYRIRKDIQARTAAVTLQEMDSVETREVTLQELLEDPRCTKNQALMLINLSYRLDGDFRPEVLAYQETEVVMNVCLQEAYTQLAEEVERRFGQKLYIREAYRTAEHQQEMIEERGDWAAEVGASEHQAGLALDVYVPYYAGAAFTKTEAGRYVDDHCWEYGFIVRYPSYGTKSTGIGYEPWHLRYVGQPHAQIIMESFLTLEEYMELLEPGKYFEYEGMLITRQTGENLRIPGDFDQVTVSEDNMGGAVLTFR